MARAQDDTLREAIADVQGASDIVITSVKPTRDGGTESYELHGAIDVELPYTNLPVGNRTPPVSLRIDF